MEKRLHELEQKVDELTKTVEHLRARLDGPARVEVVAPVALAEAPAAQVETPEPPLESAIDPAAARSAVPLVGRSLLVFAGAFVFRLITERELVSRPVGVTLGLAFASLWVFLCWREAGKGQRLSAAFHAGVASMIGFALLTEMGSKGAAAPPVTAGVLAVFTGLLLATSWRHRLPEVMWVAELGCLAAGAGLLRATDAPLSFFVVLLGLGVASVVFADLRQWPHQRWPVALFLDLVALRLVFSLSARPEAEQAGQLGPIVLVTQAVIGLYVLALLIGTWFRQRPVRTFEVIQTAVVLTVGLLAITRVHGAAGPWGLLVSGGALVTALHLAPQEGRRFDAWFYGVLGIALTFASGPLILSGAPLGLFWAVVSVGLVVLGRWRLTYLMWSGAAALAWASALPGGTLDLMLSGLVRAPDGDWSSLTRTAVVLVALSLIGWGLMTVRAGPNREEPATRVVALVLLALGVLGVAALCGHGARALLGGASASASMLILVRTLLLSAAAVGLALGRKLGAPLELNWAAWGLLVIGGLKVLVQDLPNGNAGTLVIAFLGLGLAIIAVPRLLKVG